MMDSNFLGNNPTLSKFMKTMGMQLFNFICARPFFYTQKEISFFISTQKQILIIYVIYDDPHRQ